LKNAKERMDVIAAYRDVGTYRGVAAVCGTTHKTVRRIIEAHEAASSGAAPAARVPRAPNYDEVVDVVAEKVKATAGRISTKRLLPVSPGRPGMRGRTSISGVWSLQRSGPGAAVRPGPLVVARRSGRRVRCWPSTGARRSWPAAKCTCSARCWPGRGSGSSGSPPMSSRRPRWACWRSASRSSAVSPRWCSRTGWPA